MALAASCAFLIVYLLLSDGLRQRLRQDHARTAAGIAVVAATLLWYWPTLGARLFDHGHDVAGVSIGTVDVSLNLSNRIEIWTFYVEEFMFSPLFGRGIGVGFVAAADWLPWPRMTPHNEYLHLLVSVGVVGFVLCAGAIALWYRRLLQMASDNDRLFLIALIPAIGLFAITDDVLAFSTGLALFAYLSVLLTRRAPEMTFRHVRRRHRSRPRTRGARGVPHGLTFAPRQGSALARFLQGRAPPSKLPQLLLRSGRCGMSPTPAPATCEPDKPGSGGMVLPERAMDSWRGQGNADHRDRDHSA